MTVRLFLSFELDLKLYDCLEKVGKHFIERLEKHSLVLTHQEKQMHQVFYAALNVVFSDVVWKLSQQVIK